MTTEGLANLKEVLLRAIELQANVALLMSSLQKIYLDEEDDLSGDAERSLLSAMDLVKWSMSYAVTTPKEIQKAYGIEKGLADLDKQLDNIQDNDTARTK